MTNGKALEEIVVLQISAKARTGWPYFSRAFV